MFFTQKELEEFGLSSKRNNEVKLCYIQTKVNRRRLRKKGKRHRKREKDKLEVIKDIFTDYRLTDHIAPSEIDPYWQYMYKLYMVVSYQIKYIQDVIKNDDKFYLLNDKNDEIIDILIELNDIRETLFNWLCGYFEILIRLTLTKRFWGWKFFYNDVFYPEFWELCINQLRNCSYDPDKSKPSVYFVNSMWFRGMQLGNEIINKLKSEKNFFVDGNRGTIRFNEDDIGVSHERLSDLSFDDILSDEFDSEKCLDIIINFNEKPKSPSNIQDNIIDVEINPEKCSEDESLEAPKLLDIDVCESIIHQEKQNILHSIINKIKKYFNIDDIDRVMTNKQLQQTIRDNIQKFINDADLTPEELDYLTELIEMSREF